MTASNHKMITLCDCHWSHFAIFLVVPFCDLFLWSINSPPASPNYQRMCVLLLSWPDRQDGVNHGNAQGDIARMPDPFYMGDGGVVHSGMESLARQTVEIGCISAMIWQHVASVDICHWKAHQHDSPQWRCGITSMGLCATYSNVAVSWWTTYSDDAMSWWTTYNDDTVSWWTSYSNVVWVSAKLTEMLLWVVTWQFLCPSKWRYGSPIKRINLCCHYSVEVRYDGIQQFWVYKILIVINMARIEVC